MRNIFKRAYVGPFDRQTALGLKDGFRNSKIIEGVKIKRRKGRVDKYDVYIK